MNKKFEVPYNFSKSLIYFYKKYSTYINVLYLPPYKDDLINTRTTIESKKRGHCYMPQSRCEYENHLHEIGKAGLRFVVLWQEPKQLITTEMLKYYCNLGTSGFIIANDDNAKVIKEFKKDTLVIASLVQRLGANILNKDLQYYDYIVLYYPFNRSIDGLKQLSSIKDKIILMPNTLCHIDCPSVHHWFPKEGEKFVQKRDCPALTKKDYISKCGFISPQHLYLFDSYVGGYKLQGREYSSDLIEYICLLYFKRESPLELLHAMLGKKLSSELQNVFHSLSIEKYYNI